MQVAKYSTRNDLAFQVGLRSCKLQTKMKEIEGKSRYVNGSEAVWPLVCVNEVVKNLVMQAHVSDYSCDIWDPTLLRYKKDMCV